MEGRLLSCLNEFKGMCEAKNAVKNAIMVRLPFQPCPTVTAIILGIDWQAAQSGARMKYNLYF